MEFITNRTRADVTRATYLNKRIMSGTATAKEKTEWLAGLRGSYNYTDLNRVEESVSDLSEYLDLGLTTKTNWSMLDIPSRADMERYISNLQIVKDRGASSIGVPDTMSNLTFELANNIEKMLQQVYENKATHNLWKKSSAERIYVDGYTRVYDHAIIGDTGVYVVYSSTPGKIQASQSIYFSESQGFYLPSDDTYPVSSVLGWYYPKPHGSEGDMCLKITETPRETGYSDTVIDGTTVRQYHFEFSYQVVGYAVYGPVPDWRVRDYLGGVLVPKNKLPSGTLIEGSLKDGYCYVQDADGSYYYYELQ